MTTLTILAFMAARGSMSPVSNPPGGPGDHRPLLVARVGHQRPIRDVDISPDGRFLVTCSGDDTVRLWDIGSQEELYCYAGHKRGVNAAVFAESGASIWSGGDDTYVYRWAVKDFGRGQRLGEDNRDSEVVDIRQARKAPVIVVATRSKDVTIYSPSGLPIKTFEAPLAKPAAGAKVAKPRAMSACIADDGKTVWAVYNDPPGKEGENEPPEKKSEPKGSYNGVVYGWNVEKGPMQPFAYADQEKDSDKRRFSLDYVKNHLFLSSGTVLYDLDPSSGGTRRKVDLGSPIQAIRVSDQAPIRVAVALGKTSEDEDTPTKGEIRVLDEALQEVHAPFALAATPRCVAWSPAGDYVIAGNGNDAIQLSLKTSIRHTFEGVGGAVRKVAFSPNGDRSMVQWGGTSLRIWDSNTGACSDLIKDGPGITDSALSAKGRFVAASLDDAPAHVLLIDQANGERLSLDFGNASSPARASFVGFSQDESTLVAASKISGLVVRWSPATGEPVGKPIQILPEWLTVSLSPDANTLLALYKKNLVRRYSLVDGTSKGQSPESRGDIKFLAFDPTGQRFFACSDKDAGGLYSASSFKRLVWIKPDDPQRVKSAAYSPDGKYLFTACQDQSIRVFDTSTGQHIANMDGHQSWLSSVAVIQRGSRTLALSGSIDGTARLWDVTSPSSPTKLCQLLSFEQGEWAVIDEELRFDASQVGKTEALHWILDGQAYSLVQAKSGYYEENLLGKVMNNEHLRRTEPDWQPAPRPVITLDPSSAVAKIALQQTPDGPGKVEVLINGFLVLTKNAEDPGRQTFDLDLMDRTVQERMNVRGQKNAITVRAYNAKNTLWLIDTKELDLQTVRAEVIPEVVAVNPQDGSSAESLHVVVVGVNDYANRSMRLDFAAEGAKKFAQAVRHVAEPRFGKDRVHIYEFRSGDTEHPPAKAKIFEALHQVTVQAKPQDSVVVYLSGHGVSANGTYYFLAEEATKTTLSREEAASMAISGEEIAGQLGKSVAGNKALILDTCRTKDASTAGTSRGELSDLASNYRVMVLAGCGDRQQSWEIRPLRSGLLTYALIEPLLSGGQNFAFTQDESGNVVLSTKRWFDAAVDNVPKLANLWAPATTQVPFLDVAEQVQDFPVGYLRPPVPVSLPNPPDLRLLEINDVQGSDPIDLSALLRQKLQAEANISDPVRFRCVYHSAPGRTVYLASGTYKLEGERLTMILQLKSPAGNQIAEQTFHIDNIQKNKDGLVAEAARWLNQKMPEPPVVGVSGIAAH